LNANIEIERKFLTQGEVPEAQEHCIIKQGYFPSLGLDCRIRITKTGNSWTGIVCRKTRVPGSEFSRVEEEHNADEEDALALMRMAERVLVKRRDLAVVEGKTWEIDDPLPQYV